MLVSREDGNIVEACCSGAFKGGQVAMALLVMMILLVALLDLVDTTLEWLGGNVGYPQLNLEARKTLYFHKK